MTDNNVPLLTAEMALELYEGPCDTYQCAECLMAIATGRAVVIPRRTESEWLAICAHESDGPDDYAINVDGWLAALRHIGAIQPDEKEGV